MRDSLSIVRGLGLCTVLALAIPLVTRAAPITYTFTGTVNQVAYGMGATGPNSNVPVVTGQQVPIVITVDNAAPDNNPSPALGRYSYSNFFEPLPAVNIMMSGSINGQNVTGLFGFISIMTGDSITIQSATPEIGDGFKIVLSGAHSGVLATDVIPLTLNPGDFGTATFERTVFFSPTSTGFSGTLASPTAVPLPASLPVLAVGLSSLFAVRRQLGRRC